MDQQGVTFGVGSRPDRIRNLYAAPNKHLLTASRVPCSLAPRNGSVAHGGYRAEVHTRQECPGSFARPEPCANEPRSSLRVAATLLATPIVISGPAFSHCPAKTIRGARATFHLRE